MDPHAHNKTHFGLIQMGENEARVYAGTTTAALMRMSRAEQLTYVERYFTNRVKGPVSGIGQLYMYVAYPALAKGDPNTIIAGPNGPHYDIWKRNPLWRISPNGPVTRQGIENAVQKKVEKIKAILKTSGNSSGALTGTGPKQAPSQPTSGISPGTQNA